MLAGAVVLSAAVASAQAPAPMQAPHDAKAYSPTLEDVPYPYAVHTLPLTMYGHDMRCTRCR